METFYLLVVGLLFLLAIFDLVVGVSNDAVNFLNSAIGSKVAKRKTIMLIASIGILVGAVTSGGMMEVARKGIFTPEHFYFEEIMVVFLAVMITDIILLDVFNTLAMPTSTTVSIVFEILGAALAISVIKTIHNGDPITYLFQTNDSENKIIGYMNWGKASEIIFGILLSVIVAFTIGAIVQYITRLFFTFRLKSRMYVVGSIWSGIAFTAITYFLLFKGMGAIAKDVNPDELNSLQAGFITFHTWLENHMLTFFSVAFVVWTATMFVVQRFKINPLRLVVLFGTFALAMAFAGNDLVNFIGVPIAGYESFNAWSGSGVLPAKFPMDALQGKVPTPYFFLLIAGGIMILTLWFSKKSRSVTETEVKLGSQSETEERFKPNNFARVLVNSGVKLNKKINKALPQKTLNKIADNFSQPELTLSEESMPAFDLLRASVNLVVASVLIATATGMKLPLSTTYVSFMVAMGTSLADRAWGRESAVYRIAGVMNVIGGWFLTALIATLVAAAFAVWMYYMGGIGIVVLVALIIFVIYKSSRHHSNKLKKKKLYAEKSSINYKDVHETLGLLTQDLSDSFAKINLVLDYSFKGLITEKSKKLDKAESLLEEMNEDYAMVKNGLYKIIKKNKSDETTSSHLYVLTYDLMQDLLQSLGLIVESMYTHVKNQHKPLKEEQAEMLEKVIGEISNYLSFIKESIDTGNFLAVEEAILRNRNIQREVEDTLSHQIEGVMEKTYGFKNTSLYFTLLLELKDLSAVALRFLKLYSRVELKGKLTK